MKDPCLWCSVNRCQQSHSLEIVTYRIALHQRAWDLLNGLIQPFLPALKYKRHVEKLMARSRDQLTMREHRIKANYKKLSSWMDGDDAWVAAKKVARTAEGQDNPFYFPGFSVQEYKNLAAYVPRYRDVEWE